jgi:hypothetical protein
LVRRWFNLSKWMSSASAVLGGDVSLVPGRQFLSELFHSFVASAPYLNDFISLPRLH